MSIPNGESTMSDQEKSLGELLDATELRDVTLAVAKIKSEPKAWGKITLDIRDGKIKLVEILQSIKSGS